MSVLQPPRTESERPAGPRLVAAGDLVIAYERHDKMTALVVTADGRYNNKFGNFRMSVRRFVLRRFALSLAPSCECESMCGELACPRGVAQQACVVQPHALFSFQ